MIRAKESSILLLAVFLFLAGCTESNQTAGSKLTDQEGQEILRTLLPKAADVAGGLFNGSGWFQEDIAKTIPGEKEYALVAGDRTGSALDTANVRSLADLKKAVEEVFTKEAAQTLFYSRYLDTKDAGLPLYKDFEGQLYVNTRNGGRGWATQFLLDTVKVKSQTGNAAVLGINTTVLDEPYGTLMVKIEQQNGKWLMTSGLDEYESK